MKLWLQVLFAQGYLWKDRLPDELAKAKVEPRKMGFTALVPVILVVLACLALLGGANPATGVPFLVLSVGWFLFRGFHFRPDFLLGTTHFWISASWVGGLIVATSAIVLLIASLLTEEWFLGLVSMAAWFGVVTPWLRGIQANYLILTDPAGNSWRLDPEQNPKPTGFLAASQYLFAEAYRRLPRRILFGIEAPKPTTGDAA